MKLYRSCITLVCLSLLTSASAFAIRGEDDDWGDNFSDTHGLSCANHEAGRGNQTCDLSGCQTGCYKTTLWRRSGWFSSIRYTLCECGEPPADLLASDSNERTVTLSDAELERLGLDAADRELEFHVQYEKCQQ